VLAGTVHQPLDLALGEVASLNCQIYDAWRAFLGCRFHADKLCLRGNDCLAYIPSFDSHKGRIGRFNPRNSSNAAIAINLQVAMQGARLTGQPVEAATAEGIEQAFARIQRQDASAVVIAADSFFVEQRERIAQLALKHRLPSIFSFREHVQAGGLISYGQHLADSYRRAATYVDRIFNGAKPSELPVELSTKLELIVGGQSIGSGQNGS